MDAITARAAANSQTVTSLLNDTELSLAQQVAQSATVAIVFVNADSGEEYITVEGNKGDRNNLSLWHGGDALVKIDVYFFYSHAETILACPPFRNHLPSR